MKKLFGIHTRNSNVFFIALVGLLLLTACQGAAVATTSSEVTEIITQVLPTATIVPPTPTQEPIVPAVSVADQEMVNDTLTVHRVTSATQGWIVIHADQDGSPGHVLGFSQVAQGENRDVAVTIDPSAATEKVYAMLHMDAGMIGEYEFPGDDGPVQVDGRVVVEPFEITGGLVAEPSIRVEDQDIAGGTITFPEADLLVPGWVVVHTQIEGSPGPVIGYAPLAQGKNIDVKVSVNPAEATENLYAMLHEDAGDPGSYEFPGPDVPLSVGDQILMKPFAVTGIPVSIIVLDQEIVEDTVTIRQVVSDGPGWIVIHSDAGGSPGQVIGFSPVVDGVNADVRVEIDESGSTEKLYAMLHTDAGTLGTYEFPGDDGPVLVGEQVVVTPFDITLETVATGSGESIAHIDLVDNRFQPDQLTVKAGTTVVFTNAGNFTHTVTADDGSFTSGRLRSGATFEFTFNTAGEYPFYCELHGNTGGVGMSGVIIVTSGG